MYKPKKIKKVLVNEELPKNSFHKLRKHEPIRVWLDENLTLHIQTTLSEELIEKNVREIDEVLSRFEPRERTAIDGVTYWVVFDNKKRKYSTLLHYHKYTTKKECQAVINDTAIKWHGRLTK